MLVGPPAVNPVEVVRRLLAVQGQDPRGVRLAMRARTRGSTAADVDRALGEERSLLITWLNRGTLHLVCSEDYFWLHALMAPPLVVGNARRLFQEGVTIAQSEQAVKLIESALAAEGALTRDQLGKRLSAAAIPATGQALIHLLLKACLRGVAVRGPMVGRQHAYVLVRDWLGPHRPVDRRVALAELARRYLVGHGPAGERDLAVWSGLPLRDARAGLDSISSSLEEHGGGLVGLVGPRRGRNMPSPRLLGSFDPLLMGWKSREAIVGEHRDVITVNGLFRPFALVAGRAAGTWRLAGGDVVLKPFADLAAEVVAALAEEASDVGRYLGLQDPCLMIAGPSDGPRLGTL